MLDDRAVYLAAGQLSHAAAVFFWPILQTGGRIVVMPKFDAGRALALIELHRVTHTLMVPTMIEALLDHRDVTSRNLSSLQCLNYAASPISEHTLVRAVDVFGEALYHMYAQSEVVPITMLLPHQHVPRGDRMERRRTASVGRPTPNTEVRVVDERGTALLAGEVGEIAVRSPTTMQGL